MSAEIQMSSAEDVGEFPYRAMSSTAIASVVFAVDRAAVRLFLLALSWTGGRRNRRWGFVGYRQIQRFPEEFDGKEVAITGMLLNLVILIGGAGLHTYIYLTEVPERLHPSSVLRIAAGCGRARSADR